MKKPSNKEQQVRLNVTPIRLQVILHCYDKLEPYPQRNPAITDAINFWLRMDMIIENDGDDLDDDVFMVTEKGRVYVEALCKTPFPEPSWSMSQAWVQAVANK
jgi:hypothetical protein